MSWKRRNTKPQILPYPVCIYTVGRYPERIRQLFSDGHTRVYMAETIMPGPNTITDRERKRLYRKYGGYQYRENKKERASWISGLLKRQKSI